MTAFADTLSVMN